MPKALGILIVALPLMGGPVDDLRLLHVNATGEVKCETPYREVAHLYNAYGEDEGLEARIYRSMGRRAYSPYDDVDYRSDLKRTDIEHVFSRRAAHHAGLCNAPRFAQAVRSFVTDLGNLTLATPKVNQSKGSSGPASWVYSIKSTRPDTQHRNLCAYSAVIVRTALAYNLVISEADYHELSEQLNLCEPSEGFEWAR